MAFFTLHKPAIIVSNPFPVRILKKPNYDAQQKYRYLIPVN
jgi:hypothetical protein